MALTLGFLLTLPAVNTRIHAADEIENFVYLRSIWFDRDLSFDNEYRYFMDAGYTRDPDFRVTFIEASTATGLRPNYAPVGSSILWAPFFAAADVIVRVRGSFGATTPADGLSPPYIAAIALGSAVYGALAVALGIAVARRVAGTGTAASLVVLFGTPLIFYMYAMPGMSHAPSAFAVAWFVWTWLRVRDRWTVGGVARLAAVGGLMAMVREQDAFLVIVPAVDYLLTLRERGRVALNDVLVRAAVSAAVFVAAFLPQLLAYQTLYGRFGPSPVISGKMHWTAPWGLAVMGSPEHGWFFWTPLALLAIAGLAAGAMRRGPAGPADAQRLAALLLLAVAIEVYVVGSLQSWHLKGAFGQRRFVSVSVCLAAGMAVWFKPAFADRLKRTALVTVTVLLVWWNLGLAIQFGEHSMSRDGLNLSRDLYRTFIELPARLPSVAYRYLFDRGSFYQSRVGD